MTFLCFINEPQTYGCRHSFHSGRHSERATRVSEAEGEHKSLDFAQDWFEGMVSAVEPFEGRINPTHSEGMCRGLNTLRSWRGVTALGNPKGRSPVAAGRVNALRCGIRFT